MKSLAVVYEPWFAEVSPSFQSYTSIAWVSPFSS